MRKARMKSIETQLRFYDKASTARTRAGGTLDEFPLMRMVLLIVPTLVAAIPALPHSWYPLSCCGQMDCFPTGNVFKREQIQPSQDHNCHVCLGRGRDHRSICAFIVPNV